MRVRGYASHPPEAKVCFMSHFPPPWVLTGQAACFMQAPFQVRLLVNYEYSPVGPYVEHGLVRWSPGGPHVFQMSVTSPDSVVAGRANWGFPKVLEPLKWHNDGKRIQFSGHGEPVNLKPWGPRLPLKLKFSCIQDLHGQRVQVKGRISARGRLAWRGRQLALLLDGFQMHIEAAQPLDR